MTNKDLDLAREWAPWGASSEEARAAERVIQSLPDTIVDGDKLRQIIDFRGTSISEEARKDLESLLTPPLPTLADMTPEEREACQWMQAEVLDHEDWHGGNGVITFIHEHGERPWATVMDRDGHSWDEVSLTYIVPRTDLPCLEWPGQEPQPEYRPNLGPITLTPPTREEEAEVRGQLEEPTLPRPEDVPPGEPCIVRYYGKEWVGVRADDDRAPWSIISMDGLDYRDVDDSEITLAFLLVLEAP